MASHHAVYQPEGVAVSQAQRSTKRCELLQVHRLQEKSQLSLISLKYETERTFPPLEPPSPPKKKTWFAPEFPV